MKFFLSIVVVFILFFSCDTEKELRIICTSEVRGAIFPYRLDRDDHRKRSLSHLYSYIKQSREEKDVILLDNGDILLGQPLVYYYTYENKFGPHVCSTVMNFMDYDAATVGDQDFITGPNVYEKVEKQFDFPWLAANIVDSISNKPLFKPYTIIKKGGLKVAILGLISSGSLSWYPQSKLKNIKFENILSSAKKWVNTIKYKEKPDLLIGLFHSGVNRPNSLLADPINRNSSELVARKVDGFDIVFVCHVHNGYNEEIINEFGNKVRVIGGKNGARKVSVVDVKVSGSFNNLKKEIKGEILKVENYDSDNDFNHLLLPEFYKAEQYVSAPIGYLYDKISTRDCFWGNSNLIDLIHQAQLDIGEADISFNAPFYSDITIESKELQVRDLFLLYLYENRLYTLKLKGSEIKDYLEYSYGLWFNQMTSENSPLLNISKSSKISFNTPYYNFDSAYGINYLVDVSKPIGNRIKILKMFDGSAFNSEKFYKVALNSYRANGGGGHLTKGCKIHKDSIKSRVVSQTPKDFRVYLKKWIFEKSNIHSPNHTTWEVVPREWVKAAKKREFKLLFPK